MLGFYVSAVFTRWWQIFDNIGWIDTPCLWITQYIKGETEKAKCVRRNCIRYSILTQAMVLFLLFSEFEVSLRFTVTWQQAYVNVFQLSIIW
uniref:Bestrophin homolog n=1 Tax=Caenorhabditis tropicalis TaxID=1561998 RepID=A0A1I7TFX7_9PELO